MATGTNQSSPIYPTTSGINPGAYDSRAVLSYPFGARVATGLIAGPDTLHVPSIPSYADIGTHQLSFGDDWFNRIHITTALLSLGNIISNVTQQVGVWNAWLSTPQTLNAIVATNAGGISFSGQPNPPLNFAPNQQLNWTFTVTPDGPPTVNALFDWQFADGENVYLSIVGNRITAWALTADWSNPVQERLEFKTNTMIAWTGSEQRRALRVAPRRIFTFDFQMQRQDRRILEAQLFAWSAMVWALPIWPDGQKTTVQVNPGAMSVTCDTTNRDFVAGGLAIFILNASTFEILQVQSVTTGSLTLSHPVVNTWPAGSKLFPVRSARLKDYPQIKHANGQFADGSVTFQVIDACDWPVATGLPTYRSYNVLEDSPDDSQEDDTIYQRQAVTTDPGTGVYDVDDTAQVGFPAYMHNWFLKGRTSRANFRSLLYLLKGMQGQIWVPTYQSDLELVANVSASQTVMTVEMANYYLYLAGSTNRQDIRIELTNGTVFYRRITGSTPSSGTETLSIDSSLGQAVTPAQIRRISYMSLCRLNADAIDILHHTAADGLATAATQFRALNVST